MRAFFRVADAVVVAVVDGLSECWLAGACTADYPLLPERKWGSRGWSVGGK